MLSGYVFKPYLIHKSRRYAKGIWFYRLFTPIFEDILTLKLINGFHLTHNSIVIVQLIDILWHDKPPLIRAVEHDHIRHSENIVWSGCLHARKALVKIYGMEAMYNTHSLLSPSVQMTLDLYYRKEVRHGWIYGDDHYELEMWWLYNDWLQEHRRAKEITPP